MAGTAGAAAWCRGASATAVRMPTLPCSHSSARAPGRRGNCGKSGDRDWPAVAADAAVVVDAADTPVTSSVPGRGPVEHFHVDAVGQSHAQVQRQQVPVAHGPRPHGAFRHDERGENGVDRLGVAPLCRLASPGRRRGFRRGGDRASLHAPLSSTQPAAPARGRRTCLQSARSAAPPPLTRSTRVRPATSMVTDAVMPGLSARSGFGTSITVV